MSVSINHYRKLHTAVDCYQHRWLWKTLNGVIALIFLLFHWIQ